MKLEFVKEYGETAEQAYENIKNRLKLNNSLSLLIGFECIKLNEYLDEEEIKKELGKWIQTTRNIACTCIGNNQFLFCYAKADIDRCKIFMNLASNKDFEQVLKLAKEYVEIEGE